jgi:hypothetical protein
MDAVQIDGNYLFKYGWKRMVDGMAVLTVCVLYTDLNTNFCQTM